MFCIFVGTDFSFCLICCIAGSCFCIDITLQLLVCSIQHSKPIGYVLVNRVDRICQIVIDPFDNLILFFIGTNTGCNFLMKSRIYIGEILTDRLIFLNQITFRCDILVIRNQIDPVFQSIRNVIGIFSSCRSITSCLRSSLCCISRGYSTGIFQRILNIGNITLQLLVCCIAGLSFSKIIFIELIGNRSNVFVNRIDRTYQIVIDPFDNLILFFIGTNTGCNFLMKSRIYIGEILTDRLIFLNQITFRCDILVIRNQIDVACNGLVCSIQRSKPLGYVPVNRVDRICQIAIDSLDHLVLGLVRTDPGCNFLMKSRIYIGEILTDRLIFLNQITFRCDILVSGFLIDLVIEGIISGFTGSSLIADGLLVGRNIRGVILCRRLSIFQL